MKGVGSVYELKRQMGSILFERTGLSSQPEKLLQRLQDKSEILEFNPTFSEEVNQNEVLSRVNLQKGFIVYFCCKPIGLTFEKKSMEK